MLRGTAGYVSLRILCEDGESESKCKMTVDITKCTGLDAKNSNGFSDPYVVVYFKGNKKHSKKKTRVVHKTLDPAFDESFVYEINNKGAMMIDSLVVEVWDHGTFSKNDFIGWVVIPIKEAIEFCGEPCNTADPDEPCDCINTAIYAKGPTADCTWQPHVDGVPAEDVHDPNASVHSFADFLAAGGGSPKPSFDPYDDEVNQAGHSCENVEALSLREIPSLAKRGAHRLIMWFRWMPWKHKLVAMVILPAALHLLAWLPALAYWAGTMAMMYPFWCVFASMWYLPAILLFPRALGLLMTFVITNIALHGFKLTFGEFHVVPWIGVDRKLHLKVTVTRLGFGNPPGDSDSGAKCFATSPAAPTLSRVCAFARCLFNTNAGTEMSCILFFALGCLLCSKVSRTSIL